MGKHTQAKGELERADCRGEWTAELMGCATGLPEVSMSRAPSPVIKDPGSSLPWTSVQALRPGGRLGGGQAREDSLPLGTGS